MIVVTVEEQTVANRKNIALGVLTITDSVEGDTTVYRVLLTDASGTRLETRFFHASEHPGIFALVSRALAALEIDHR